MSWSWFRRTDPFERKLIIPIDAARPVFIDAA